MSKPKYDVVIIGAGISGLLIASELVKKFSVLIIDKNASIVANKYWLTDNKVFDDNNYSHLHDCIDIKYTHMDFIAYNGYSYRCEDEYLLWDSNKLIDLLFTVFIQNGGEFLHSHRFYSYSYTRKNILVKANEKTIHAKLMIDCMGYESPVAVSNDLLKLEGYYILYGGKLKLKQNVEPTCLANLILNKRAKYLEIFPTSEQEAYTAILYPSTRKFVADSIKSDFDFLINKSEYSKYFESNGNCFIGGIVPVGKLRKNSLDRIFFYGEAAQMNPSATGTCLTKLLKNYKCIARNLEKLIRKDELSQNDLNIPKKKLGQIYNRKFQLRLYDEVLKWSSSDFLYILKQLDTSHSKIINEILFEDLDLRSILNYRLFWSSLRSNQYYIIKLFLKSLFKRIN